MLAPDYASLAAEFPNDNPVLHRGARWLCRDTVGPARAVRLAFAEAGQLAVDPQEATPARALTAPPPAPSAPPSVHYEGPLQLDLDRIVIPHRVENVPPPPDFILRPLARSSSARASESIAPARAAAAVESACLVLLSPPSVEPAAASAATRLDAAAGAERARSVEMAAGVSPQAGGAGVDKARSGRQRGPTPSRRLATSPLPEPTEIQQAIAELEAAFAKPALHSNPREGLRVIPCPAGGA